MSILGWALGSEDTAIRLIRRLGLYEPLLWCVRQLNRLLGGKDNG